MFKHHGKPPSTEGGLFCFFFIFAFLVSIDFVLLMSMMVHITSPLANLSTIGITFLLAYPGVAVLAPVCGLMGSFYGSPTLLKAQSSMNAACVLVNYPATIVMQIIVADEPVYICIVAALWLNKVALSFYGAKVRQHLINPGFLVNQTKF